VDILLAHFREVAGSALGVLTGSVFVIAFILYLGAKILKESDVTIFKALGVSIAGELTFLLFLVLDWRLPILGPWTPVVFACAVTLVIIATAFEVALGKAIVLMLLTLGVYILGVGSGWLPLDLTVFETAAGKPLIP
jgi:hypothetical protein